MTDMTAMNMNKEQFEQLIRGEKPVLVDFWAPWCGYCRRIGPAYEKIGEEYKDTLVAGKINIDEESQLAEAEQIEVIPTLVLYRNGKAIDSIVAPESKAMIDRFIKDALEK
ncbi:MAG: thioredoxin [Clostridium sp.]